MQVPGRRRRRVVGRAATGRRRPGWGRPGRGGRTPHRALPRRPLASAGGRQGEGGRSCGGRPGPGGVRAGAQRAGGLPPGLVRSPADTGWRRLHCLSMGATATLEAPALAVEPGAEASVKLRVRNTGQVVDPFAFQVLGDPGGWSAGDPPPLSLFPGAEEVTTIRFRPPRASSVPAGEVPFAVRVVSREDPDAAAVEDRLPAIGSF